MINSLVRFVQRQVGLRQFIDLAVEVSLRSAPRIRDVGVPQKTSRRARPRPHALANPHPPLRLRSGRPLRAIVLVDVEFETRDGRTITLPRITEPEKEQAALLLQLGWTLPQQPPPRIRPPSLPPGD